MKLPGKLAKQTDIDIVDYYAVKPYSIWKGLKHEGAAFWWLCIFLFFEYVRPQNIYKVIDVLPWAQIALLLACFTAISDKDIKLVKNPANALFISFTAIVFLSALFAFNPTIAFDKIDIPIVWLIFYFLITSTVNTEKRFFVFALLFLLVNFKMSQHGFMTYAQRGFGYAKWGLTGSPGWFGNAADFGIQMVIFTPLATAFILALRNYWGRYKRLFFYLLPITALISIVGTASRGAQVGLVATGIWFLLKSIKGIKVTLGILILGGVMYSFLPEKMLAEYSSAGEDETSENRLVLWQYGLDIAKENPIFGVGLENWYKYCWYHNRFYVALTDSGRRVICKEVHNTYIEALVEIGVPGFVFFVLNIVYILILNARTRANANQIGNKFIWYIAHGLDGGLIGCMVSSIFISVLFYPIFWVQLALTVSLHEISKKQLPVSTKSQFKSQT